MQAPVRRRDRSLPASSFHSSVLPGQYTRRRASEKTKKTKGIDLMSHSVSKERAGKYLSHLWEGEKKSVSFILFCLHNFILHLRMDEKYFL